MAGWWYTQAKLLEAEVARLTTRLQEVEADNAKLKVICARLEEKLQDAHGALDALTGRTT